jgi:hypothetical protein
MADSKGLDMNDQHIKQMVERFLQWKLPEDFNPDAGISFEPTYNTGTEYVGKHQPVGTNLLTYTQAEAMVRFIVADIGTGGAEKPTT